MLLGYNPLIFIVFDDNVRVVDDNKHPVSQKSDVKSGLLMENNVQSVEY